MPLAWLLGLLVAKEQLYLQLGRLPKVGVFFH